MVRLALAPLPVSFSYKSEKFLCGTGVLAIVLLALVPIGVPSVLLAAMGLETWQRHKSFDFDGGRNFYEHNNRLLSRRFRMVMRAYRPGCECYEMMDWLRKMLLGGMLMMLHRGSVLQVIVGTVTSFSFFGLHLGLRPYRKSASNWLKSCVEAQIFLTMLLTLVVRFVDKLQLTGEIIAVAGYEWALVSTFVVLVPGAFIVCTASTVRQRSRGKSLSLEMREAGRFTTESLGTSLLGGAEASQSTTEPASGPALGSD